MRLDLKTRLDLRVEQQVRAYLSVGRYHAQNVLGAGWGTQAFAANYLYGVPLHIPEDMSFDRIASRITLQAVGAARMGIYKDNGFTYPGALALDSGAIDTNVLGDSIVAVNVTLRAGLYWLAWLSNATPTIVQITQNVIPAITGAADPSQTPGPIYLVAQAYGALPDPFPAGAGYSWADSPGIFLRRSA